MREVRARNGKTGLSVGGVQLANPLYKPRTWGSELKVAKLTILVPRKAAIVFIVPVP